jgi:tetratricopeptide (TPR) repeat protein
MTDMTVHVGDGRGKPKKPRWQFLLGLALAVVLAIAAGGLVRYLQYKDRSASILGKPPDLPVSVTDSQDLLKSGKTAEAEKSVQDALAKASTSKEERRLLYVEQGRIAIVKEDYQAAVDAFTKAWEIKETYEVANKLGSSWLHLNDKPKALEFYKKAMQLNPKDSPTYEAENNVLKQMIVMLEGEQ